MKPFINVIVVVVANVIAVVLAQGTGPVPSQPVTSEPPTTTPSVFDIHVSDHDVEAFVQTLNCAPGLSTLMPSSSRILELATFRKRQISIDLWLRLRAVVHVLGKYVPWTGIQPAENHDVLRFITYIASIWNQQANPRFGDSRFVELDRVLDQQAGVLRAKLFPPAVADPSDLSRNVGAICKMLGEERNRISQSVDVLLRRSRSQSVPAKDVERVLHVVQGSVRTIGRCEQLTQLVDQYLVPFEDKAVVDGDFLWALSKLELVVLEIERVLGVATAPALVIVAYKIICNDGKSSPIHPDEQPSTEEQQDARAREFLNLQKILLKFPSYDEDVVSPLSMPIHMQVQLYERAMSHDNQIRYEGRNIFMAIQDQVRRLPSTNPDNGRDLSSLMFLIAVLYRRPTLDANMRAVVLDNYIEFLQTVMHARHDDGFVLALAYALWRDETDTTRIAKCCVSAGSKNSAVLKVLSVLTQEPLRLRIPKRLVTQPSDEIVEYLLDAVIRGTIVAAPAESDPSATSSKSRQKTTRRWFSTPIRCLTSSSSTNSSDGGGGGNRSASPGPSRKQEKPPTATHVARTLCQYV